MVKTVETVPVHAKKFGDLPNSLADIAAREQAEETRARLAAIVTSSDDAIVSKDLNGIVTSWNQGAERLFGYTAEEAIGRPITIVIPEDRLHEEPEILGRIQRGKRIDHFETVRRHKDGTLLDISLTISPIIDSAGRIIGASKIARDITERKRAEEALRQTHLRLEAELADTRLLQTVSAEIVHEANVDVLYQKILDAAVSIMRSDFGSMQMLYPERGAAGELRLLAFRGFSPEAAQFWTWVRADSKCTCGVALQTGNRVIVEDIERCEFMIGTDDQRTYRETAIAAVQSTPLVSRAGKLVGMISTHWRKPHQPSERDLRLLDILARQAADLLERKKAEEALWEVQQELRRQNEKLEEAVAQRTLKLRETIAELEAYSYSISHDMRAPLRAMQTYSHVLLTDYADALDATGKRYLNRIMVSSNRLDKLIQDVLSYSRVARADVKVEAINLDHLVEDLCNEYPTVRAADLKVMHPLGSVVAAEALLAQAVSNLLTNAAKFVAPGEIPRIKVWSEHIAPAEPGAKPLIKLFVRDEGIGVAPDDQQRIFGIFSRVHSEKDYEGTGIGLSIVKKAIERMGGCVGLKSKPGQGSTFWLQLPKA